MTISAIHLPSLLRSCILIGAIMMVTMMSLLLLIEATPLDNQYDYAIERDRLLAEEKARHFASDIKLSDDERIVDAYLDVIYTNEQQRMLDMGMNPSAQFFSQVRTQISADTPFWRFVKALPKGGNLHIHDSAIVDRSWLLQKYHNDANLYFFDTQGSTPLYGSLGFYTYPPVGWKSASLYPLDTLLDFATVRNLTGSFLMDTFPLFQAIFQRTNDFIGYEPVYRDMISNILETAAADNILYLEPRVTFGSTYKLINSTVNGGRVINDAVGDYDVALWHDIAKAFATSHPDFYGLRTIIQTFRGLAHTQMSAAVTAAVAMHKRWPEFTVGFDMVGEEDFGGPLLYHSHELSIGMNDAIINQSATSNGRLSLFLHAGESNWQRRSVYPRGIVKPIDNLYDALIIGARRLGHGVALMKRPYLVDLARERDICVEVSPLSNQILGYVPDLRNHPASGWIQSGLQISIASDDPGIFGYVQLSYDYYTAIIAWGLDLASLKKISRNGITYSGLSLAERAVALQLWQKKWDAFIASIRSTVACTLDKSSLPLPQIDFVFPTTVPDSGTVTVTIFGSGFARSICSTIICNFGDVNSTATARYVSSTQIICERPSGLNIGVTYPVKILVDDVWFSAPQTLQTYRAVSPPSDESTWQLQWYHWLVMAISVIVLGIASCAFIRHCKKPRHTPERLLG